MAEEKQKKDTLGRNRSEEYKKTLKIDLPFEEALKIVTKDKEKPKK